MHAVDQYMSSYSFIIRHSEKLWPAPLPPLFKAAILLLYMASYCTTLVLLPTKDRSPIQNTDEGLSTNLVVMYETKKEGKEEDHWNLMVKNELTSTFHMNSNAKVTARTLQYAATERCNVVAEKLF
jgi:hypothetical protein